MASTPRRVKAFVQLQRLSASRLGNGSSSLRQELRPEDIPETQKASDADEKMMDEDELCIPRVDSWVVAQIFRSRYDSKVGQFELKEVTVKKDDKGGVAVRVDIAACLEWWEG